MTPGEKKIELDAILHDLNEDERSVVVDVALVIARRMMTGRTRYQPLDLAKDPRDWTAEAFEEAVDGAAYLAMALIQRAKRK